MVSSSVAVLIHNTNDTIGKFTIEFVRRCTLVRILFHIRQSIGNTRRRPIIVEPYRMLACIFSPMTIAMVFCNVQTTLIVEAYRHWVG